MDPASFQPHSQYNKKIHQNVKDFKDILVPKNPLFHFVIYFYLFSGQAFLDPPSPSPSPDGSNHPILISSQHGQKNQIKSIISGRKLYTFIASLINCKMHKQIITCNLVFIFRCQMEGMLNKIKLMFAFSERQYSFRNKPIQSLIVFFLELMK